jgi:thioredoxin reductase
VEYGRWFQRHTAPDLDSRRITRIESDSPGFRLTLSDGEEFKSRRVAIAAGIGSFARRLPQFANLPPELVSHASDGSNVNQFSGKRVLVVGAGQSALESAALIHEAGAQVEVIVRAPNVHWLTWKARIQKLGPIAHLLYSPYDIGPAGVSRIVALPDTVKYFPRSVQNRFRTRALRPAGSRWLVDRFTNIPISTGRFVTTAKEEGGKVRVHLDDGSSREIDHILLGTGYRVDVSRYPFLSPELAQKVKQEQGFPILAPGFESSVPGLHFLGAPSAWNFGPLMFFVCGTDYAGNRLARYMAAHGSRNGTR